MKFFSIQKDPIQSFQLNTKSKMLAVSPPLFPTSSSWSLEDLIINHQFLPKNDNLTYSNNNISGETETSDSLLPSPTSSRPQSNGLNLMNTSKKHHHNASERDRRKRVNNMYSSIRSLLPEEDQKKKLSIPGTVSSVLNYITKLQKEVEGLVHKRDKLLSSISSQEVNHKTKAQKCSVTSSPLLALSVSPLGDKEVLVQLSSVKVGDKNFCIEALEQLEDEDGLLLLNAFSFESIDGRAFNSLHLQVQGNRTVDIEILREKLFSLYEKTPEQHYL